jgi:hypothetical protein
MELIAGIPTSAQEIMAGFDRLATIYPQLSLATSIDPSSA